MTATSSPVPSQPPKVLDRLADALRARGYVAALRQAYLDWARRYICFHHVRHPQEMAAPEVAAFLDHLSRSTDLPPAAAVEARAALVFLYEVVLGQPLGELPTEVGRPPAGLAGDLRPRPGGDGPRFLDQVRHVLRVRHYAYRTEDCYVDWARRFILFHDKRHPSDLGTTHVTQFLTHLAVEGNVSVSTQTQALNALVFLYKQVLDMDLGRLDHVRARRPERLPLVASVESAPGGVLGQEVELILSDVLGVEEVRRAAEMPGEACDGGDVGADGSWGVVAEAEVVEQPLA